MSPIADFDTMSSIADIWRKELVMPIRTPADLGALIRDSRTRLALNQKSLAEKVGVSRQWIVEIEKGKPRASIGLLLRTIGALGMALDAEKEGPGKPQDTSLSHGADAHVDIDSIVASARRKRK
jgi:HTH-type transcriptional regulator/antitoxin HipB